MVKSRGSFLLKGVLGLFLSTFLVMNCFWLFRQALQTGRAIQEELELRRASTELRCRLANFFRYRCRDCEIESGTAGRSLTCRTGREQQEVRFYCSLSPSSHRQTLYVAVRETNRSEAGINPLSSPHLDVTDLSWELIPPDRISCSLVLSLPEGGRKRPFREVFRYGSP